MPQLSDGDWERISQFANTPRHERDPEILIPDGADAPDRDEA